MKPGSRQPTVRAGEPAEWQEFIMWHSYTSQHSTQPKEIHLQNNKIATFIYV